MRFKIIWNIIFVFIASFLFCTTSLFAEDLKSPFPVFGFLEDESGMAFQVGPGECSEKSYYEPMIQKVVEGAYKGVAELTFLQKGEIENCQNRDHKQWVYFNYSELESLGLNDIFISIKNPRGFSQGRQVSFPTEEVSPNSAIWGYKSDEKGLSILAMSGGCTGKSNFEAQVDTKSDPIGSYSQIKITRTKKDGCETGPSKVWIQFSFKELGIDDNKAFVVTNPHPLVFSRTKIVQ